MGRERYYVLVEGPSTSQDDDVILDVKLQSAPTPYHYVSLSLRNDYDVHFDNHAQRHAVAYKALIDEADNHLGWIAISVNDFSVRERSPFKEIFDPTELSTKNHYQEMAAQWGAILATSHARADKDSNASIVGHSVDKQIDEETNGRHAEFRALVREIAFEYAEQVYADWGEFKTGLLLRPC